MNVMVRIRFDEPKEEDWQSMRSLARRLTSDRDTVRVYADEEHANWLVAEFTVPTEAQYKAVERIDRVLRFEVENRLDSVIGFPRSAAQEAGARRRNERRKARRRERDGRS